MSKPVKVGIIFVIINITTMLFFYLLQAEYPFTLMFVGIIYLLYPLKFLPEIVADFLSGIYPFVILCNLFLVGYLPAKIYYFIKEKYNKK